MNPGAASESRATPPPEAGVHPKLAANLRAYSSAEAVAMYTAHYGLRPVERLLVDTHLRPRMRIADLACGAGRTTVPLHEAGFRVTGIDLSEPLIAAARRRFPDLDFRAGSYCRLDLADASFDAALISHNGLDYAYPATERAAALAECARILVPGGRLIFSSHNIKSLHGSPYYLHPLRRLAWMLRHAATAFQRVSYVLDLNGQWTCFASPRHVQDEIERAGFDLVDAVGFRQSRSRWFNTFVSPWVHYVCSRRA